MKTALIVFGEDWGRHPSSTQHIIKHLCRERQVIWVNSIGLRRPRFNLYDLKRAWEKFSNWWLQAGNEVRPDPSIPENLEVIQPMVFPAAQSRWLRWLNRVLLTRQIKQTCKALKVTQPDLWISLPSAVDYVGHLQEQKVIYYCGDDFNALAGVDHDHISQCEVELVDKAHHILVASQALWTKFSGLHDWKDKLVLVEHGVDLELFTSPTKPAPLLNGERPVVGFYGSIAEWIDFELVAKAAKALPHWRFVFIGRVETDISAIESLPNVELFPPVPHHELPRYAQHWQASILPFLNSGQIQACNPLKLKEYLACGRPVISTPFQAVDHYRDVVDIVRNQREFIEAIERCARPRINTQTLQEKQRAVVQNESWRVKAKGVSLLLA